MGLAVSGGPDSLALLLLAAEAFPGRFEVATVDHQLRPESGQEAQAVALLCRKLDVPHAILMADVPPGNLQAEARRARYAALDRWARSRDLEGIVTAHHADDQAETFLMRLDRGAGVRGLAGMRAKAPLPGPLPEHARQLSRQPLVLIRPLLGWRRGILAQIVEDAGLVAIDDPSNSDERFARIAVRARLVGDEWLDPMAIAHSAAHCADATEALHWAAEREVAERVEWSVTGALYRPGAPRAVRLLALELIVKRIGTEGSPRGSEYARLADTLEAGEIATLGGLRCVSKGGEWHFAAAPPRS